MCLDKGIKRWDNLTHWFLMWDEEKMDKPQTVWLDQERKEQTKQSTMKGNGLSSQFLVFFFY